MADSAGVTVKENTIHDAFFFSLFWVKIKAVTADTNGRMLQYCHLQANWSNSSNNWFQTRYVLQKSLKKF